MAKRIETIMAEGVAEVNHRGQDVEVSLPNWFRAQDSFFDEEKLVEHCRKHGILLATLQEGFAQHIINIRAKARPAPLPPKEKGGDPIPQEITAEAAQERVDAWTPEPREPVKAKKEPTVEELMTLGLTREQAVQVKNLHK